MSGGVGGVRAVLGASRDSQYSGSRRGIGDIWDIWEAPRGVGDHLGLFGGIRDVGGVRGILEG